jgi:hypothetical protein
LVSLEANFCESDWSEAGTISNGQLSLEFPLKCMAVGVAFPQRETVKISSSF